MDILKIATFNINGIRPRVPALLEWLEREGPDVVCLQELKAPDAAFPINDIHAAGYGAIWHGQTSWNGVAILAKAGKPARASRSNPKSKARLQHPPASYVHVANRPSDTDRPVKTGCCYESR